MGAKQESGPTLALLKGAAKQLYESLRQLENECADTDQKGRIELTKAQCRDMFLHLKNFISTVLCDLESTREQLNRSSDQMLGQVSEQLSKVTESTQDAVQTVLNKLDAICEKQNEVFQGLSDMKSCIGTLHETKDCSTLAKATDRLEELENEIQTETFEIMNAMQFQDITSQQMQQANALIVEAKSKLTDLHVLLNLFKSDEEVQELTGGDGQPRTYDPGATMKDRENRQRLADEIETGFKDKEKD